MSSFHTLSKLTATAKNIKATSYLPVTVKLGAFLAKKEKL